MTAPEKSFQLAPVFVFIFHAAAANVQPPERISPSKFYVLYLQNPVSLYRDTFIYSVAGDDSNLYHIVPKNALRLKNNINNDQNSRSLKSSSENPRHVIQSKNVVSREVAENHDRFTRREKVYPQYSRSYLRPILSTPTPYENPWKPLKNDGSTFDIKISKTIKVSDPVKLNRPLSQSEESSKYDSSPNERLPTFHFNITFTHPDFEDVSENRNGRVGGNYHSVEYNQPITPSWRPFSRPLNTQNSTPPFRKPKTLLQEPKVTTDSYTNNNHKGPLNHGIHENAEDHVDRHVYRDNANRQISHYPHIFDARPTPPYDVLFPDQVTIGFASKAPSLPPFEPVTEIPEEKNDQKQPGENTTFYSFTPIRKIAVENRLNTSLTERNQNERYPPTKNASFIIRPLFEHKISVLTNNSKPRITYFGSKLDKETSSKPLSVSNKYYNNRPSQNVIYNDSISNILNRTINNGHFVYPSIKDNVETIEISRKSVPILKARIPTMSPVGSPNPHHSFTTKEGTFFEVNIPTKLFPPMLKKNIVTFDDKPGSSTSDLIRRKNDPEYRETERVNVQRFPPGNTETVTKKPPVNQRPKVKLTAGFLAGVLIAALVFLGFLIGTSIYAFHQWKYGKHRKNKKKTNYSPDFLDDTFVGNTYLHNNIYLPTPQNIEEITSVDSDSFINGIEAITSDNYSSENSRNTTV